MTNQIQIIKPANSEVFSLLGTQKIILGRKYEKSKNMYVVRVADGLLMVSCITGEIIKVYNIENSKPYLINSSLNFT